MAPMTVANKVVYAGSITSATDKNNMYALYAKTGKILWNFKGGGLIVASAAVVDSTVYSGSGYTHVPGEFQSNDKFYAFTVEEAIVFIC
ncbi:MAG: PQQ-binding-like beta-propeller repeat protein [Rhizonema sp. PD38]|nr:PQQ-binding-like beta-propeller repeat protein [Rhizonema sp. PD38]